MSYRNKAHLPDTDYRIKTIRIRISFLGIFEGNYRLTNNSIHET